MSVNFDGLILYYVCYSKFGFEKFESFNAYDEYFNFWFEEKPEHGIEFNLKYNKDLFSSIEVSEDLSKYACRNSIGEKYSLFLRILSQYVETKQNLNCFKVKGAWAQTMRSAYNYYHTDDINSVVRAMNIEKYACTSVDKVFRKMMKNIYNEIIETDG